MLKKIRIALALLFLAGITLLLVGVGQQWWGWMAKLQFLPACLALNVAVIAGVVVLTLLFGRIYCSVICPLGVFQDVVIWLRREAGKIRRNRSNRRIKAAKEAGKPIPKPAKDLIKRFGYKKEKKVLRYTVLALFILCLVLGLQVVVALIAPYSAYGRMVQSVVNPSGWVVPLVAGVTLVALVWLSWTSGREWCNSVCPVGTTLSFFSRFSLFRIKIDSSKCNACGRCYRGCKASCIDGAHHKVDYSRCIDCFDCIDRCSSNAIHYRLAFSKTNTKPEPSGSDGKSCIDTSRRAFLVGAVLAGTAVAANAQNRELDGGLVPLVGKKAPQRAQKLTPPGSKGEKNFYSHCTACQLCVANCPNHVLRPSTDLEHLMQPEMGFEHGFCRPECTACSQVCPAGAILPVTAEQKTSISIGHAVVDYDLCVVNKDGVSCGNCAAHCPAGAISMVRKDPSDEASPRIPSVNQERCIGCGKCEYLCPSRPLSAIHIEGNVSHIVS